MDEIKPLENLSTIQDLMDLYEFMEDDDFGAALDLVIKCIANPNMTPATARKSLLLMQAYAMKFKMMGQVFMTIKKGKAGSHEVQKKNVYYSISEQCHELAQTLKYLAKETM